MSTKTISTKLKTPLDERTVRSLKAGDVVYLSGTIYTARDEAHIHALELEKAGRSQEIPVNLKNSVIFHCGPIAIEKKGKEKGKYKIIAAGPTTSSRMNSLEPEAIERFGIRAIIGKGGMDSKVLEAMKKHGCVYLACTGGCAVSLAKRIKEVKDVFWLHLGMPEAIWVLEVEDFGPLIVGMDSQGKSLYEQVNKTVRENAEKVLKKIS